MQPRGSKCCGQACIAMIIQESLEDVCGQLGTNRGTKAKKLAEFLQGKGIPCNKRLIRVSKKRPLPERALVKMKFDDTHNWHWVLKWRGVVFDPGYRITTVDEIRHSMYGRLTSFIDLG